MMLTLFALNACDLLISTSIHDRPRLRLLDDLTVNHGGVAVVTTADYVVPPIADEQPRHSIYGLHPRRRRACRVHRRTVHLPGFVVM